MAKAGHRARQNEAAVAETVGCLKESGEVKPGGRIWMGNWEELDGKILEAPEALGQLRGSDSLRYIVL